MTVVTCGLGKRDHIFLQHLLRDRICRARGTRVRAPRKGKPSETAGRKASTLKLSSEPWEWGCRKEKMVLDSAVSLLELARCARVSVIRSAVHHVDRGGIAVSMTIAFAD